MRTPDAIRQQRVRRRRRLGLRMVQVEISEEAIELLAKRGYVPRRDKVSIDRQGYDEPEFLSYAISPFCPTGADGLQGRRSGIPFLGLRD
jgi:hypothetical protein